GNQVVDPQGVLLLGHRAGVVLALVEGPIDPAQGAGNHQLVGDDPLGLHLDTVKVGAGGVVDKGDGLGAVGALVGQQLGLLNVVVEHVVIGGVQLQAVVEELALHAQLDVGGGFLIKGNCGVPPQAAQVLAAGTAGAGTLDIGEDIVGDKPVEAQLPGDELIGAVVLPGAVGGVRIGGGVGAGGLEAALGGAVGAVLDTLDNHWLGVLGVAQAPGEVQRLGEMQSAGEERRAALVVVHGGIEGAGADPAQIPADAAGVGVVDALLGEPVDAGDPLQAPVHGGAGELPLNRLLLRLLHKGAHKVVDGGGGAVDIAEELGFHIPPAVDQLGAEIVVDIVAGGE